MVPTSDRSTPGTRSATRRARAQYKTPAGPTVLLRQRIYRSARSAPALPAPGPSNKHCAADPAQPYAVDAPLGRRHFGDLERKTVEAWLLHDFAADPPPPWHKPRDGLALRLIGAALLVGAATLGLEQHAAAWPAWLMLAGGLYLVLRR